MNKTLETTFSRRLREVLGRLGLSQSELARRIGVTPQAVQRWCNGIGEPRKKALEEISRVTETPIPWFYTAYEDLTDTMSRISFGHIDELADDRKPILISPEEERLINIFRDLPGEERRKMLTIFEVRLKEINDFVERFMSNNKNKI